MGIALIPGSARFGFGSYTAGTPLFQLFATTIDRGSAIVVCLSIRTTTSVTTLTDTQGNTYVLQTSINNSTNIRSEIWVCFPTQFQVTTADSLSIKYTVTQKAATVVAGYSGVGAIGAKGSNTQSTANPTISLTTTGGSSWVIAGHAGQGTGTFATGTGNLRASGATSGGSAATNCGSDLVDNTVVNPSSVTCSAINADTIWANVILELKPKIRLLSMTGAGT